MSDEITEQPANPVQSQPVQADPNAVVHFLRIQLSSAMMESAINAAALQNAMQENMALRNRIAELEGNQ